MRRAQVAALVAGLLVLVLATPVYLGPAAIPTSWGLAAASTDTPSGVYVVVLRTAPLSTYHGAQPGYPATAPAPGHRYDAARVAVTAYRGYLLAQQRHLLDAVGSPPTLYHYTVALDGFAARLTGRQVKQLRRLPQVLSVQPSTLLHLDLGSRASLGRGRSFGESGTSVRFRGHAPGHQVVIGVIDSGLWPDNPSFAGLPTSRAALRRQLPGFTGTCQPGADWRPSDCTTKVVAARYFIKGFGRQQISASEFVSPRDASGHGTHVAATAAGNAGVAVTIEHQRFGRVSGADPAARLAIYKACWVAPDPSRDGCSLLDVLKAIDLAVSDGVDVINYSVTGASSAPDDAVELAFLNAASAGVFVAAAAGNTGPDPGTVQHLSPWETTVAASNLKPFIGAVRLGNGAFFTGSMVSSHALGPRPLVYAGDVPARGSTRRQARLCRPGALAATGVDQAIVVCDRGVIARVLKSEAVAQAGGAGMVLVNRTAGSTVPDVHAVPTVHVDEAAGAAIEAYVARAPAPTARLVPRPAQQASPKVADFSGRGPASNQADVLKPNLAAPGVGILGAVAPGSNFGHLWDVYTGTSMSTPAAAGDAGRVLAVHPSWTPAEVQSALMTTAAHVAGASPFVAGAGQVRPERAVDPGLVYPATPNEWDRYLAGLGVDMSNAGSASPIPATELNQPAIEVDSLVGTDSVTRTVANVSGASEVYTAWLRPPPGIAVSVTPGTLQLAPGQTGRFTVTFNARRSARYAGYSAGTLQWRGSAGHRVTSPIVVRPEFVRAPAELSGSGVRGNILVRAMAGVTGTLHPRAVGLVGARPIPYALTPGGFDPGHPRVGPSTVAKLIHVDAGALVARFDARPAGPSDDVDLYVYRGGRLLASATHPAGPEQVTLNHPAAGTYTVYVTAAASATGGPARCTLTSWVLDPRERLHPTNITVTPRPVTVTGGRGFGVEVAWSGLDPSKRWFGYLDYQRPGQRTYLTIN